MKVINPTISLQGVSKIYSGKGAVAVGLHKANIDLYMGEFLAVTGSSGSGKSTLLNILSGIDSYEEGEMFLFGEPTSHYSEEERSKYRKDNVAFIFQDYNIIESYTVYKNVELALLSQNLTKHTRKKVINDLLAKVGLLSHAKHRASKLSGGQKQRVSIARALAKDAPILFADEPTGNLDSKTSKEILQLLKELSKDKLVVLVTHSYEEVKEFSTRMVRLADGEIIVDTTLNESVKEEYQPKTITAISSKKTLKAISLVAKNNILATPKKSIFSLTGLIVMSLMFVWILVGLIILNEGGDFYGGSSYLDIQITSKEGAITQEDINEIEKIEGVVLVRYYIGTLNGTVGYQFEGSSDRFMAHLRPVSAFDATLFKGRLPQNMEEVVISIPAKRKYTAVDFLGKELEVEIIGAQRTLTIVGLVINKDAAFVVDEFIPQIPMAGEVNFDKTIVAIADSANNVKNIMRQAEQKGYYANYLHAGSKSMGLAKNLILLFSVLSTILMIHLFRGLQGSVKAINLTKSHDYNIFRTVGLSNKFIKLVYYAEMLIIAIAAWVISNIVSFVSVIIYSNVATFSSYYGIIIIKKYMSTYTLISAISLCVLLSVTLSNAAKFNKRFFKHTVKNSLLED